MTGKKKSHSEVNKYVDFSELDPFVLSQYRNTFELAFPEIILSSEVVKSCWDKVEKYFPHYQRILIGQNSDLIGFINTVPLHWDGLLTDLPSAGWDWLINKGISDYENGLVSNCLGGLQVVVSKNYLGGGYSKKLIAEGKSIQEKSGFKNFIIPIRPTFKSKHPEVRMKDYMHLEKGGNIYDPWIRTHLKSGAQVIKVCSNSMNVKGDLPFWENLVGQKISQSGTYVVEGALNLVDVNVEKNSGEYREENIWIKYS